jgi:ABC-type transport system involved in multi-copper enzyme maturation permease subunit
VLRRILTIIKYELLMQIKTMRFKGMIALSMFFSFALYQMSVYHMELKPSHTFLNFEVMPFYLIAIIFAGLYSMGRIRKTGMHSILMVKPFNTFHLALGQMLGGLISLLIPLFIIFFTTGLIMKWQFEIEYPFKLLFYVILHMMIPAICCILSVTIWIRTCFKNNIVSIIIIGFIVVGAAVLGSNLHIYNPDPGMKIHIFTPFVSHVSPKYWEIIHHLESQNSPISFLKKSDWFNFSLSMIFCFIFLTLSTYHLRRTEPQRKVLGSYGRRWYHAPTFLKIACDLKIDPHVKFRTHLLLVIMIIFLISKTVWGVFWPYYKTRMEYKKNISNVSTKKMEELYNAGYVHKDSILPIITIRDSIIRTDKKLTQEITFECTPHKNVGPTSRTLAVIAPFSMWDMTIKKISIENNNIPFITYNGYTYIEGKDIIIYCNGQKYIMKIKSKNKPGIMSSREEASFSIVRLKGYYFIHGKRKLRLDRDYGRFDWRNKFLWPSRYEITKNAKETLISTPVEPEIVEMPKTKNKFRKYIFNIPKEKNGPLSQIIFTNGWMKKVEYKNEKCRIDFIVPSDKVKIFREILELADPVISEFCSIYHIETEEPLRIDSNRGMINFYLSEIKRTCKIYRRKGGIYHWRRGQYFKQFDELEAELLKEIFRKYFCQGGTINDFNNLWDIQRFIEPNLNRGMNNHLSLSNDFKSGEFQNVTISMDTKRINKIKKLPRKDVSDIPLFQMLYLIMGKEKFISMLNILRPELYKDFVSPEMVEKAAKKAYGKPLKRFFDYWLRNGKDFPCFKINRAEAKIISSNDDETSYSVEVDITNIGTGRILVPVYLQSGKSGQTAKVWIGPGETVTWKTSSKKLPGKIIVDPEGWILKAPYWDKKNKIWYFWADKKIEIISNDGDGS